MSAYDRSTCRHCGKDIYPIPSGDGLWVHGTDPIARTALCEEPPEDGVLLTAAPPGALGADVTEKIVGVISYQTLADHLGDVRRAEVDLWELLGVDAADLSAALDYHDEDPYAVFVHVCRMHGIDFGGDNLADDGGPICGCEVPT